MRIIRIVAGLLACAIVSGLAAQAATADPVTVAQYVTMRDGVRIAIDLSLPAGLPADKRIGAVVTATRYQRAKVDAKPSSAARYWTDAGYAFVNVDARGTGASFGSRTGEWSSAEIRDYDQLLDWIATQPWSNGRAGAYGTSYGGNTAELMASTGNPHIRAVAPLFPDYDVYEDLAFPGGLPNRFMLTNWLALTRALDGIDGAVCEAAKVMGEDCTAFAQQVARPKPVDGPDGPALLAAAVREHQRSVDLRSTVAKMGFKDRRTSWSWATGSPYAHRKATERAGVPMLTAASWLDAGTANGSLSRLLTLKVPQEAYIGAWSHGAGFTADPFRPADEAGTLEVDGLMLRMRDFFDRHVQRGERAVPGRVLRYATLGEKAFRTTRTWPLRGTETARWYLDAGNGLARHRPTDRRATDRYRLDPSTRSGTTGRWETQLGGDDVVYADRRGEDRKLLTYTSPPMVRDTRVAGLAKLTLRLASTRKDGGLFAYLEDVGPDGRVTYLTEGQLRLADRRVARRDAPHRVLRTPRTYARRDARAMVPGRVETIRMDLLPTAARIRAGHRIRIAIAGADADHFATLPADGKATYTVHRNAERPSYVELPVAPTR